MTGSAPGGHCGAPLLLFLDGVLVLEILLMEAAQDIIFVVALPYFI
jgi:hypothetical protein